MFSLLFGDTVSISELNGAEEFNLGLTLFSDFLTSETLFSAFLTTETLFKSFLIGGFSATFIFGFAIGFALAGLLAFSKLFLLLVK